MYILKTLHILILIRFCWCKKSLTSRTYLSLMRIGPCRLAKVTELMIVSEMSLYQETRSSGTFSGWLQVNQDIENGWSVKAIMEKCHDIRNLDTCDFLKSDTVVRNGCLESSTDLLHNFFQSVTKCPVKAGNYTIDNFPYLTVNLTSAETRISTSMFGYIRSLMGYNQDGERIFCIESHLRLNYASHRDWGVRLKSDVPTTSAPELQEEDPETIDDAADDEPA